MNYKTVIAFGDQNASGIIDKYKDLLDEPQRRRLRNIHISGFWFGYAQCIRMVFIGLVFWIGGLIINWYDECVVNVFVGIFIMFTALMGASMSFANVPSLGIAKAAAN